MSDLSQYQRLAADWRGDLLKNQRKTRNVIILFILIYVCVGLVIDIYMAGTFNPNPHTLQNPDLKTTFLDLITFKIMPIASMIMLCVAAISIFITFYFHKGLMMLGTEYHEVNPNKFESSQEQQLYNIIEELKIAAGLNFMPKVYIIEADYMNAFASGYSEKTAMVAITRGLLEKLNRNEIQAVMAHELSHVRHNDIKLALTVAILSNIIIIALDLLFRGILFGGNDRRNNVLVVIIVLARFLLPILTLLLMLYLSRTREFMADAGSVELVRDNQPLASALLKIDADHKENVEAYESAYTSTAHENIRQASYLYDPSYAGIKCIESINNLFSSHPPLEERLKALGLEKPPQRGQTGPFSEQLNN